MRKKPTILVVDDNENLCKVLSAILKHKGYNVSTAINGLEAIVIMYKIPHDIVLMDIKMPLVDGIDAYLAIKNLGYQTKTILMTAYTSEERIKHYMNNGIYDIIFKPIDINRILKLIEEISNK
jgi:two-component system response regulator AtoC